MTRLERVCCVLFVAVLPARLVEAGHRGIKLVTTQDVADNLGTTGNAEDIFFYYPVIRVTAPSVIVGTLFWRECAGQPGVRCHYGEDWKGPVWDLLTFIRDTTPGLSFIRQNVSASSIAASPDPTSEWWGCLHMLQQNLTDLCVGDYWIDRPKRDYLTPSGTFSHSFADERVS